jgi:hypothetical protein
MMNARKPSRLLAGFRFGALLCAFLLVAVSLIVYSPLHRHDPSKPGPCALCQFSHLGAEPAGEIMPIPVPSATSWWETSLTPGPACQSLVLPAFGRAPPVSPSSN